MFGETLLITMLLEEQAVCSGVAVFEVQFSILPKIWSMVIADTAI